MTTRKAATKVFFRPTNLWRIAGILLIGAGTTVWKMIGVVKLDIPKFPTDLHTSLIVAGIILLAWPQVQEFMKFLITMRTGKEPTQGGPQQ